MVDSDLLDLKTASSLLFLIRGRLAQHFLDLKTASSLSFRSENGELATFFNLFTANFLF